MEQLQNRFLFPNPMVATQENDPLGTLPEGWGEFSNLMLKITQETRYKYIYCDIIFVSFGKH